MKCFIHGLFNMDDHRVPSSLEPKSRGGEIAEQGFIYQTGVLLAYIPKWLALDGFSGMIRESIGDVEIKIFTPGKGTRCEFMEIKNHQLKPSEFWDEVNRFIEVDAGSPETFQWFRLIVPDVSKDLKPVVNGLRRIQSPYGFYDHNSAVVRNSERDFIGLVSRLGVSETIARFLYRRVLIDTTFSSEPQDWHGHFFSNLIREFPEFDSVPSKSIRAVYDSLKECVSASNQLVTRKEMIAAIASVVSDEQISTRPIRLHTANTTEAGRPELVLDWSDFSGNRDRTYPESSEWNLRVVDQLVEVKDFILDSRLNRTVRITGMRRLSATIAIGTILSATGGFVLEMEYREGEWWKTNDHGQHEVDLQLEVEGPNVSDKQMNVIIGIPRDISSSVSHFLQLQNLSHLPVLSISYLQPITSVGHANSLVARIKTEILKALTYTSARKIHLFCSMPAFMALLLGHRLNATSTIQCYEFVAPNNYVPTCLLNT